ncbi:hypothetical protein [Methylomonas fluvii]|uniref:Uncharacterized protein n=1 Tax=Methylomonas fluvii TaxID=1854564 RepID=A0ABR9D7V6_9GAMM|nr:hypothetical protein [Methylomonas fluvii]MBD9359194.1 hypothetical protein [Methylomonas fluvii]
MIIKIINIDSSKGKKNIKFETPVGVGRGIWEGELLAAGQLIDVEIDVEDTLQWGVTLSISNNKTSGIALDNNGFSFVAEVVSYEGDGCLVIKLAESIILLDVNGMPSDIHGWVQGKADTVRLYPTNL